MLINDELCHLLPERELSCMSSDIYYTSIVHDSYYGALSGLYLIQAFFQSQSILVSKEINIPLIFRKPMKAKKSHHGNWPIEKLLVNAPENEKNKIINHFGSKQNEAHAVLKRPV